MPNSAIQQEVAAGVPIFFKTFDSSSETIVKVNRKSLVINIQRFWLHYFPPFTGRNSRMPFLCNY